MINCGFLDNLSDGDDVPEYSLFPCGLKWAPFDGISKPEEALGNHGTQLRWKAFDRSSLAIIPNILIAHLPGVERVVILFIKEQISDILQVGGEVSHQSHKLIEAGSIPVPATIMRKA